MYLETKDGKVSADLLLAEAVDMINRRNCSYFDEETILYAFFNISEEDAKDCIKRLVKSKVLDKTKTEEGYKVCK